MLGFWGTLVSCLQASILEHKALMHTSWTTPMLLYFFGFQLCLFGVYVLTSTFLTFADAGLFNLSLLTSDFYSLIFSGLVQHQKFSLTYGAAFATTISGLVLYHTQPVVVAAFSMEERSNINGRARLRTVQIVDEPCTS